jgi:hypothetical protein
MSKTAVFGDYIPLREIELVNRFNSAKANVAYAQSYLAVKYLYDEYGVEAVSLLLDSLATGATVGASLMAATGSNYSDFQEEFELYLTTHYNLSTLFADTMYLWLALAIVVIIGVIIRYRKRREYYRKWEEHERLHATDFDYGDPDQPEKIDDDDEPWKS